MGNESAYESGELLVVTYNMLHGFGNRLNQQTLGLRLTLLAEEIIRLKPDVVLLQEVSVTQEFRYCNVADALRRKVNGELESEGISYNSVFFAAHGSKLIGFYEGEAILSRYKISGAEKHRFAAQAITPPESRIAVRATLEVGRRRIDVVSTHLTNQKESFAGESVVVRQAVELSHLIDLWSREREMVIVGGDFNAVPDSDAIAAFLEGGAVDVWQVKGGSLDATSLAGEVDEAEAGLYKRIDYLFVVGNREDFTISEVAKFLDFPRYANETYPSLWASDHAGVIARITFSGSLRDERGE